MGLNNQLTVEWFLARIGKLTYSMTGSRNGADGTADCSGSMTQSIKDSGGVNYDYLYSTVTLGNYLGKNGYQRISVNQDWDAQKGDVVLMSWGKDMSTSGGAGGHVGVMVNATDFISCDYWTSGQPGTAITQHNWNEYYAVTQPNYIEVWRVNNSQPGPQVQALVQEKPAPKPKRRYGYRVDDLQFLNGIWQVRNDVLGQPDFDWTDNGINVAYIDKIDPGTGENTPDQTLNVGDYFAFQPTSVGIITEQVNTAGKTLSHVQFPDEFIWLYTPSIEKLIYG
ncbi:lytic exoenzyme target recognition domain-containing protein [Enterococcus sp. DIV1420a]|uniref:lytic exoenzyme target recognition domain-containing protein n=1 Tax=Enterococcus sp. DIV1420a TaxID=2774672 RepID=UPI003F280E4A